jgi:hypothetical protein
VSEPTPAPVEGKTCSKCNEFKPLDQYPVRTTSRDGRRSDCQACNLAYHRAFYRQNADRQGVEPRFVPPEGTKRCGHCQHVKPKDEFGYNRCRKDGHRSTCKPCVAEISRQRYQDPEVRAKHKALRDRWRADNPTYLRETYLENREQRIAAAIEYAKRNPVDPAVKRARDRKWYARTADERRAVKNAWKAKNADLVRESHRRGSSRRRARVRELPVEPYTVEDLIARDGADCVLCGYGLNFSVQHPHPMSVTVEHLECIAWPDSAGDVPSNVALSHFHCNNSRRTGPHPAAAAKRAELLAAEATTT